MTSTTAVSELWNSLFEGAVRRRLKRGEVLHLTGDRSARVHQIQHGVMLEVARDRSGAETIVGLVGHRQVVDVASAADGSPHHCDAFAATDCLVAGVDAAWFRRKVECDSTLAMALAGSLAARVRRLSDTAHERSAQRVEGRVASGLLDMAAVLGREVDGEIELELPVGQREFGRFAGTSRESTCKTLRRFKDQGLVDYRGRRLRILRPDALSYLRCAGR